MLIQLDRHHLGAGLEEACGERSDAGSDLDHPIPGDHTSGADDPFDGVGIDDEVLAERARRLDAVSFEEIAYRGSAEHGARLPATHRRNRD